LSVLDLATAALIVFCGAAVQTVVGFGMGLFAIPLLIFSGRSLPEAVALSVGAGFVQLLIGLRAVRREVVWKEAIGLAAIQGACVPVGTLGMRLLADAGPDRVKQGVGALLLVVLAVRQLARPEPRDRVPWSLGALAAALAGLLGGLVGMGGPPLVIFALAHRWRTDRFRAFLWSQFVLAVPVMVLALAARFGPAVLEPFALGIALTPCVWAGARVGRRLSAHWEAPSLHRSVLVLLYALAVTSILGPLLGAHADSGAAAASPQPPASVAAP